MTKLYLSLPCVFIAATAAAQPADEPPPPPASAAAVPSESPVYVSAGVLVSLDVFLNSAWLFDAGVKLPHLPVWVRGTAASGGSRDADSGGEFWRLTTGVEARWCSHSDQCAFIGLDAGYQHQTWVSEPDMSDLENHHGVVVEPRLGIDVGGDHLRFRGALELYDYRREQDAPSSTATAWKPGAGITLGMAYRL